MYQEQLQNICEGEVRKTNFQGRVFTRLTRKKPHFSAKTGLLTREIEIGYNPEYEAKGEDPEQALSDIPKHEMDHHGYREKGITFKGCPRNTELSDKLIYTPMFKVLKKGGYSRRDVEYIENTFEDTLLHTDLKRIHTLEGIVDFFSDVGACSQGMDKREGYGNFYEAHVKLNLFLWGNRQQKKRLSKYFRHTKESREAVINFLERTEIKKMRDAEGFYDRTRIRDFLMDETNWKGLAKIYAEEFSKLIQPGYARHLFNHSGAGTKGRESEDSTAEGKEFDKERETRDYKRGRIQESYDQGEKLPDWISDTIERKIDALDLLYESLARRLEIRAESRTESEGLPIAGFGFRPFDPLKDKPKGIKLIPERGKLEWKVRKHKINIPIPLIQSEIGFPSIRYGLLDTSSSMKEPINGNSSGSTRIFPWGDNSKYHFSLLGLWGYFEYLRANSLLDPNKVELYTFHEAGKTRVSIGLTKVKKHALNPIFGSDTTIDPEKISRIFLGEGNLIFTISDGNIGNWNDIRNKFISGANKNHYFHLQIGGENKVTKDMEKNGLFVVQITKGEDIARATIDLTRRVRNR